MEKGARIAQAADPRAVQELCRHELIEKVLADVLVDMTVCRMEGWDVLELPLMLREEMDGIIQRATRTRNAQVETVSKSERVEANERNGRDEDGGIPRQDREGIGEDRGMHGAFRGGRREGQGHAGGRARRGGR